MNSSVPTVPDLKRVVECVITNTTSAVPDMKFLRKMNAHNIVPDCNIFSFVSVTRKRKGRDSSPTVESVDKTDVQDWMCDSCNTTLIYVRKDAQRVCPNCGKSSFFQEMTRGDMISQGYTPTTAYLYKRHNHFKTWLKRTQGKETTCVPQEVIDMVKKKLKKERITDMSIVDHKKIKSILKKLRQNRYYNHCVQLTTIVTGKPAPQMTPYQEESLLQMFERVQVPFETIVMGKSRQNMLSYSFLIHKFLQIMNWDEYLPYFPLLVSADKIQIQDAIWKQLCQEVGFEYIKSTM